MSAKFDTKDPDLLHSTALALVWSEKAQSSAPQQPEPTPETPEPAPVAAAPEPEIDGDEEEYVPLSVEMMAAMLRAIVNIRYAPRIGEIDIHSFEREEGVYSFGFWPSMLAEEAKKEQTAESEPMDVYTDPDFYDSVQNFLTDFSEFCDGKNVEIHFDAVGLTALSKMDMFKALSDYITNPEYALSTPDTAYLPEDNSFDPDIRHQQEQHRQQKHIDEVRPDLDRQPRERELGQYGADPFFAVNNSPFSSMREFQQACYIASKASLPFSLNHVFTTICQEDMLDPQDFDYIKRGGQLTMGGYN